MKSNSNDMRMTIGVEFQEHLDVIKTVGETQIENLSLIAELMVEAFQRNKKVFLMGNGGSAADAQHLAAELVGRFKAERKALPAIALSTDTSILTALANDYGYENVFSRQILALASEGDVVIGISTSGRSPNVLKAIKVAGKLGCKTVGLTGQDGGDLGKMVDVSIRVPSHEVARIQEAHITIGHIICGLVEKAFVA